MQLSLEINTTYSEPSHPPFAFCRWVVRNQELCGTIPESVAAMVTYYSTSTSLGSLCPSSPPTTGALQGPKDTTAQTRPRYTLRQLHGPDLGFHKQHNVYMARVNAMFDHAV